jgi:two-component system, sensor histidine kinase and response regulator
MTIMLQMPNSPASILIIDDEPDNFDVIEAFLHGQNYQLHYAAHGHVALEGWHIFQPDLILLDIMMPDIDGIEICRRIKANPDWQMVPIMMVTALSSKTDLAECLQAGADDFIAKPIHATELRARVQSLIRIKQQYDHLQTLLQVQTKTAVLLENTLTEFRHNLASTLSHELNTPLHGILSTLEMLKDYVNQTHAPTAQKLLGWANQSARRLEHVTSRSRLYLDLELATLQPCSDPPAPLQLSSTAIQAELLALAKSYQRQDDLVFALEESYLGIPENYLQILFQEIVTNAIKFSEPGSEILVQSQVVGETLQILVQDKGHGIKPDHIKQIGAFVQFERQIYEQQGIGMGLQIVQKIADLAGGKFMLESTYEQGTTVTVILPTLHHLQPRCFAKIS